MATVGQRLMALEKTLDIRYGVCASENMGFMDRVIGVLEAQQKALDQLGERCERLESRIGEEQL